MEIIAAAATVLGWIWGSYFIYKGLKYVQKEKGLAPLMRDHFNYGRKLAMAHYL